VAEAAAARGLPVILDLGFTSRAERDAMRGRIAAAGHEAVLLHLTAPRQTRQARIRRRNAERGETYAFTVTDGMFAALDARFEPPQPDEYPRAAA
jgi:predicted kinase